MAGRPKPEKGGAGGLAHVRNEAYVSRSGNTARLDIGYCSAEVSHHTCMTEAVHYHVADGCILQ